MEHLRFGFAGLTLTELHHSWLLKASRKCWVPARTAGTFLPEGGRWLPLKSNIKLQLTEVLVKATSMIQVTLSAGK